ncbi:hypothetical protein [Streptomyces soliscabiei]|uniref:hypothetical protein n=1 Tax=Streptomyces soliscabiei TaxID=588897 RepID=UPI0029BA2284|nr:hypothetical protein [Streptomyces sp. NY05-11A]MDX2682814.1 hypothetical protein [Streptomyces sp. NY05-11A]
MVRGVRHDAGIVVAAGPLTIAVSGEEEQRRVVEERVRVARALHDLVAHHLPLAGGPTPRRPGGPAGSEIGECPVPGSASSRSSAPAGPAWWRPLRWRRTRTQARRAQRRSGETGACAACIGPAVSTPHP